ncbi:NAD-dependent epimerase/dehydratase family protein [Candidatus Micrarchaeota archaeon]|nr:NAD-dependent epimerase/dehydratase family protein [Candidatus Micrarchaeota archaeon]
MLNGRKVFITGGSGFIGINLINALLRTDVGEIVSLVNVTELGIKDPRVKTVHGNINDYKKLVGAMQGCDTVFHLAAYADVTAANKKPIESFIVTCEGTLTALKAAVDAASVENFLYVSSARVYGNALYRPIDEKHPLQPVEMYGAAKLSGEIVSTAFYHSYGLNTVNLRIFSVYGAGRIMKEGSTTGVVPIFVDKALKNQNLTVIGDGTQTKDFIHISDVCNAMVTMADRKIGKGESFNLGTGKATSINEFAQLVLEITKSKGKLINLPANKESVSNVSDISKARKAFGFEPRVSLREGLTEFVKWYEQYLAGKATGTL